MLDTREIFSMKFSDLVDYADNLLQIKNFSPDYCVNGVQVETTREIRKIVSGATASLALINEAVVLDADVVVVHHGVFWNGDPPVMTGITKGRVSALLAANIGLLAYHLPLDAHPDVGNNVCLARLMGWNWEGETFGRHNLGFVGSLDYSIPAHEFSQNICSTLGREPLFICNDRNKLIRKVAWVTGAGQGYFKGAVSLGVDAFVTGEASEFVYHVAMETGVAYVAAGHHATERYGVQSLCKLLADTFGLDHQYLELDNPV